MLVTRGGCEIEGLYAGKWQRARYAKGDIGMTAPGESVRLRWWDAHDKETLQLHIPASTLADVAKLDPSWTEEIRLPHQLTFPDQVVESVLLNLRRAVELKMPSLYADSAVHFLANHLLQFHARIRPMGSLGRDPGRMAMVDALMRSSLSFDLSLDALAGEVGLSKFHFLRVFKETFGETPFQRLTRLRMEKARLLLDDHTRTVTDIAMDCGYGNPGHFAVAFRRAYGVSPLAFRFRKSR